MRLQLGHLKICEFKVAAYLLGIPTGSTV